MGDLCPSLEGWMDEGNMIVSENQFGVLML